MSKNNSLKDFEKQRENCAMILARSENNVIGYKGQLPWNCAEDMEHFKKTTSGSACICGYKTYLTLPENGLPNRTLYVLTKKLIENKENVFFVKSLEDFFDYYFSSKVKVFCIGGLQLYKSFLPYATKIYLTQINGIFKGDVFFTDDLLENFSPKLIKQTQTCKYFLYSRKNRSGR